MHATHARSPSSSGGSWPRRVRSLSPRSASRSQHARNLSHRRGLVGERTEGALAHYGIEAAVGEVCQVLGVALLEANAIGEAFALRRVLRRANTRRAVIHPNHLAAENPREVQRRCAAARGQVEHATPGVESEQHTESFGQIETTRVKRITEEQAHPVAGIQVGATTP